MDFKKLLIFCIFCNTVHSCLYSVNYGDMTPSTAVVKVGDDLIFNCTVTDQYIKNSEINISQVYFTRTLALLNTPEIIIDQNNVNILSPNTVQLVMHNVSLEHCGFFFCKFNRSLDHKPTPICYSDAKIGFPPLNVSDFKCIYYYFEKFSCSWTIPENLIETKYSLYYYFHGYAEEQKPCMNESIIDNRQSCYWDLSNEITHSEIYHLILEGENKLGNSTQAFELNLTSIVKLPKPRNFRYSKNTLQWNSPENVLLDEVLKHLLLYRIDVIDSNDEIIDFEIIQHDHQSNLATYQLPELRPYSRYKFNISCKTDDDSNDNWSDAESISIVTPPNAPVIPPKIIKQSFETSYLVSSERHVTIYWESVSRENQNGPDFEYFVSYSEEFENNWLNNTTTYPNITLKLKPNVAYLFKIYSKNRIGLSSEYSRFKLPSNRHILWNNNSNELDNKIKVIMLDHGHYEIAWSPIDMTIIRDYTLFWCKSRNGKCIGQIHWQSTKENHTTFTVSNSNEMKFGVAFNTVHQTTGIIWVKCLVDMLNKKVDLIFYATDISSDSVLLNWRLKCEAQRQLIDNFTIQYCSKLEHCKTVLVDKEKDNYLIKGLEPNTKYSVDLIISPKIYSKIYVDTNLQIPPSPEDFSVTLVNDSKFFLKWTPPKNLSLIDFYRIELVGQSLSSSHYHEKFEIKNESCTERTCNYTTKELAFLKPYENYSFFLESCNKRCSEKMQKVYRTKASYPGLMVPPKVDPIYNKLRVHLKPPFEKNGPIDRYYIQIYQNEDILLEDYCSGSRSYIDIDFESCKKIKTKEKYYISVKASNFLNKIELNGTYSEKMPITLYCPPIYNYFILFSIVGIMIFLIVLYFVFRYTYRMFKSIKQKNEEFSLTIAMEDPSLMEQFNKSNRESVDANNVSESSLMESDSANAKTNSSNTINEQAIFSSEEMANMTLDNNNLQKKAHSKNNKHYIKDIVHPFCSSDSGVSDVNHHDNLEYFWNQDDSREPFLKKSNTPPKKITIQNGGSNYKPSTTYKASTSAPNSSLPSPEHHSSTTTGVDITPSRSPPSNLSTISSTNTKQTYVMIPSSTTKYLPHTQHSHTTHLPDSYNVNQV